MSRLLAVTVKIAAAAALILAGSSCTTPHKTLATVDLGGAWPGWQDIDEGGFEERGWVLWPEAGTAAFYGAKVATPIYSGKSGYAAVVTTEPVDYEFYVQRTGLARLCPFTSYVRLRISNDIVANRVVLDQAAASGGIVHVSGRQRSGLRPGAAYVKVNRVTPVKPAKRIAW
jgi:hypothetical protein